MAAQLALATDLAIIIVAAAIIGLIANQTGQPTIVAYLLTGLLLGPAVLGVVTPGEITATMAKLGLAFLLFLLGSKMRIEDVEHVLRPVVNVSLPQMALVCLTGLATASLLGFSLWESLLIGVTVMYSSTAVVIKMLTDKDEVTSLPGKIDVGILLVQDIVVVILLTVLASGRPDSVADVGIVLVTILGLVAGIGFVTAAASRYLLPKMFRRIADNKDVFLLVAVAWAFLFIFVSDALGLSIEMGAFIAGVALAQLPYSTELRERIAPLTDLFILTFFVSIGLRMEPAALFAYWQEAVIAAVVLMPAKFLIFFALLDWQGFSLETTFLGSTNMIQVSEFALVAGAVAVASGLVEDSILGFLSLLAILTMSISVYVIKYNHQLYERLSPYLDSRESDEERAIAQEEYRDHAVVIGYDEVTRGTLPVLEEFYDDVVVIDRRIAHVETLTDAGYDAIYGDSRHAEIRKRARLTHADFVLSSSDELDVNKALLADVGEGTTVFVEAQWEDDARELYADGAHYVVMAPQLTAERLAEYLEAYFVDPATFTTAIETDVRRLRRSDPVIQTPERLDGGLDE